MAVTAGRFTAVVQRSGGRGRVLGDGALENAAPAWRGRTWVSLSDGVDLAEERPSFFGCASFRSGFACADDYKYASKEMRHNAGHKVEQASIAESSTADPTVHSLCVFFPIPPPGSFSHFSPTPNSQFEHAVLYTQYSVISTQYVCILYLVIRPIETDV